MTETAVTSGTADSRLDSIRDLAQQLDLDVRDYALQVLREGNLSEDQRTALIQLAQKKSGERPYGGGDSLTWKWARKFEYVAALAMPGVDVVNIALELLRGQSLTGVQKENLEQLAAGYKAGSQSVSTQRREGRRGLVVNGEK